MTSVVLAQLAQILLFFLSFLAECCEKHVLLMYPLKPDEAPLHLLACLVKSGVANVLALLRFIEIFVYLGGE
jgi:hypothetical protein